jgi:uracil-DNA glycosylase
MTTRDQSSIDQICRDLYGETRDFLERNEINPPFGFKILNGPPIRNAEILFIGYQPGGSEKDAKEERTKGTDRGWPPICEYAIETWPLAPRMRQVFGAERLKRCVGTNAIFLRYPNANRYRRELSSKRNDIEKFCTEKVAIIVEAIEPKQIVTIGFATLKMFGPTKPELISESERRYALTKTGKVANREALGIIHLSGARPSRSDLTRLASHLQAQ